MEHLLLKAATTATEEGVFEAVISTATIDRDGDIVEPQAMVTALAKWVKVGKLVPLAWAHGEEVVGNIDPATARANGNEVTAAGRVDLEHARGKEAWRLVKSGTLSFSFGYLIPEGGATKRTGAAKGLHITELDVFEISVVPVGPANNDTRVISWKSIQERDAIITELQDVKARLDKLEQHVQEKSVDATGKETKSRSVDPLREHARQIAQEVMRGGVKPPEQVKQAPPPGPDMSPDELREHARDLIVHVLSGSEE
jgi:HK97 family phage prohead protease